jgi:hypothetical protein
LSSLFSSLLHPLFFLPFDPSHALPLLILLGYFERKKFEQSKCWES